MGDKVGDKLGDTVVGTRETVGDTQWETREAQRETKWETQWKTTVRIHVRGKKSHDTTSLLREIETWTQLDSFLLWGMSQSRRRKETNEGNQVKQGIRRAGHH